MLPYYDQCEIERAARECNIIDVQDITSDMYQATLRPMFSLQKAIVLGGEDVTVILGIFMTSFGPLTFEQIEKAFEEREGRPLPATAFMVLLDQGALRKTKLNNICPATTTFDLQDICRTMRNLIYQMTDEPQAIYVVPNEIADFDRLYRGIRSEDSMNSIHYLLEFSGDCTKPYFEIDKVMKDFKPFFEYLGEDARGCRGYRLRQCVIAGEPSPEEKEKMHKKKEKKGLSRVDRPSTRVNVDASRKR
ncbi:hypothetical protein BIW11_05563 [Tropilaelaps mercedesae]|uniref:Uncharacterized protein n=1 Tax=Tropilaelaps mercedesae TaxID=418985 RepID=A0A1V9Y1R3_9ACAR|nr:hypothetical protein BIW11_05563 [Tropilaelaps mercedesae]